MPLKEFVHLPEVAATVHNGATYQVRGDMTRKHDIAPCHDEKSNENLYPVQPPSTPLRPLSDPLKGSEMFRNAPPGGAAAGHHSGVFR
eukprot:8784849-Pyramimonas_sp.AAC.1